MTTIYIDLSAPESHATSAMPKALRDIYYSGKRGDTLLGLIESTGYPLRGGTHALKVFGKRPDVVAWLDLFLEHYPDTKPEIDIIKKEIRKIFIHEPDRRLVQIKLSQFTRQHGYNGQLITRKWFWTEHHEPDYKA